MFPKVIYICNKNLDFIKHYSKNWKILNPDYEIKLYDDNLCNEFLKNEFSQLHSDIFNYIKDGPIKADFWRVCIVYKYGGLYVDADIEPLLPLKDYIEKEADFVSCLGYNDNPFNPHFIMANKEDDFLKKCIDTYIDYYNNKKRYSYWGWSITLIFTQLLKNMNFYNTHNLYDGLYTIENKKYQFINEIFPHRANLNDVYCVYKGLRVFNNRYKIYNSTKHDFTSFVPGGSWIHSVKSYKINGNKLEAYLCTTGNKVNQRSVIICENVHYKNDNGEFTIENCLDKEILPKGNWIYTATSYRIEDGVLYANLVNDSLSVVSSNIKINNDQSYINLNGILKSKTYNLNLYLNEPGIIPKYINKRDDIIIQNEFFLKKEEDDFNSYNCVIYFLSNNKIKILLRSLYNCEKEISIIIYSIDKKEKFIIDIEKYLNKFYVGEFLTDIDIISQNNNYEQEIPKIILETYKTKDILNYKQYNLIMSKLELNPEYEYYFFEEFERKEFIKLYFEENILKAYDSLISDDKKIEHFVYCFLFMKGGCYIKPKNKFMCQQLKNIINKNEKYFILNNNYEHLILSFNSNNKILMDVINEYCENINNKCYIFDNISILKKKIKEYLEFDINYDEDKYSILDSKNKIDSSKLYIDYFCDDIYIKENQNYKKIY